MVTCNELLSKHSPFLLGYEEYICIVIMVFFSSVFEHISSYEHFPAKREGGGHRKAVRTL